MRLNLNQLWVMLAILPIYAHAIDIQPGEVVAPMPGTQVIQTFAVYSQRGDLYAHGHKVSDQVGIDSMQYLLRYGTAIDLAGLPGYFYTQVPVAHIWGDKQLAKLDSDSGMGDITMLVALWPYVNRERQRYFALAGYLTLPTGSYDHGRVLNVGENRYKTALQAGYQSAITPKLSWMGLIDTVWYGDNRDFGPSRTTLEQKAYSTAQFGLFYYINSTYVIAGQYFYSFGGDTSINGIDRLDENRLHRYLISAYAKYGFGKVGIQYGQDIKTDNGYKEDNRLIVRYIKSF